MIMSNLIVYANTPKPDLAEAIVSEEVKFSHNHHLRKFDEELEP